MHADDIGVVTKIGSSIYRVSVGYSPVGTFTTRGEAEQALRDLGLTEYLFQETTVSETLVKL